MTSSSMEKGLYFVGLTWMHTIASSLFSGVGDDAQHLVGHLANTLLSV